MANQSGMHKVLRPIREALDTRRPAVLIAAAFVGLALLIGAPMLVAQDHGHEAAPAAQEHSTPADAHATDAHGKDGGHGEKQEGVEHFPTLIVIIASLIDGHKLHGGTTEANLSHISHPVAYFLIFWEDVIYSAVLIALLSFLFYRATRKMELIPGKLQNFVEAIVEGLDGFVKGVIGPEGRKFVPFLGTLGLYVYTMNIFGLIPFMKSPTSVLNTTLAMAICVFVYVQWTGIRANGIGGFLRHLAGDPKDVVGWGMVPLMMPLHVIGELAKPLSLSLRLFGNIMGEELLLAVFAGLGVALLAFTHLPIGFPLHLPFVFLGLLTTAIQATVFTLLSTIYISLVLPHHDHGEHGHEAH